MSRMSRMSRGAIRTAGTPVRWGTLLRLAWLTAAASAAAWGQAPAAEETQETGSAAAAQPDAPTLSSTDARDFLGEWVLTVKAQDGQELDLDLRFHDRGGIAVAEIEMPRLGTTTVEQMITTEEGIRLFYDVAFGEQRIDVQMDLKRIGEGLIGKMADQSGLFSLGFTGVDRQTLLALDQTAEGDRDRRRRRRGGDSETATLALHGQEIRLRYDQVPIDDRAYRLVASPVDGVVLGYVKNRPGKLFTPIDLRFGDAVVKAHNHGPDYPGVYSVWLKRQDGGWRLVFNHLADVWGTQHDPAQDAVEVPLRVAQAAEPAAVMTVKLEPAGDGGLLRIAWGEIEWTAPFEAESAGR